MSNTTQTRRVYTVPAYAKKALGAKQARKIAREAMAEAKRNGATFKQAVAHIEDQIDAAIEFYEMQDIEQRASIFGYGYRSYL